MGADIGEKTVMSEYSCELALACRNNPDGSMPFNRDFYVPEGTDDGAEKVVAGGVIGILGNVNISDINGATGESIRIIELDKEDTVAVDLSGISSPTSATLASIAAALNADLNPIASFPNIGHGFHASVTSGNRLKISADIPIVTTGIPTFTNGSATVTENPAVTIKEGTLTADSITLTLASGTVTNTDFLAALETAITGATFTNAGHSYEASIVDGQIVVASALPMPEAVPLMIVNPVDGEGDVTSYVASTLQLDKPYWRPIREMASLTATVNTTDADTVENSDGVGVVTSVTTEQSSTGVTVALIDAERNVLTKQALCGGFYNKNTGRYSPKKAGVAAPSIGLLCFSKVFGKGSFGMSGNTIVETSVYPSNTVISNNHDKNQGDFNQDTYDITASDSAFMSVNTQLYLTKDEADKYIAFSNII
jgi:hypothetical protein